MPKTEFGTLTKTETIVLWEQWISPVRPINYLRTVSILICRFMRMQTNAPGSERMKMMAILVLVSVFSACVFFLSLSLGFFLCFCFFFFFLFCCLWFWRSRDKSDGYWFSVFLPLLSGFSFFCSFAPGFLFLLFPCFLFLFPPLRSVLLLCKPPCVCSLLFVRSSL